MHADHRVTDSTSGATLFERYPQTATELGLVFNNHDFRRLTIDATIEVTPELNGTELDADANLRETCDIDSTDHLNLLRAVKNCRISKSDRGYLNVQTLNQFAAYWENRSEK